MASELQEDRKSKIGRRLAEIDEETLRRHELAVDQLCHYGDPILKTKADPVERFDDALRQEIHRMGLLLDDMLAAGLAANQVGLLSRLFVYRVEQGGPMSVMINPSFEPIGDETETDVEGCLSIPNVWVPVERFFRIKGTAYDEFGNERKFEVEGLEARVIQHETDHLDGILTLDRTSKEERREAIHSLNSA